jgi:DNA-binding PadR family transcriptional regulator
MQELTGFQRDVLFVLNGLGASHGARLKRELERARYESVLPGRLYHNLDVLVEQSFVEKREGSGRENEYQLTQEGRASIREHNEWQQRYVDQPAREESIPS